MAKKIKGNFTKTGNRFISYLAVVLFISQSAYSEVEYKPLSVGGLQEIGQIRDGIIGTNLLPLKNEWVDHFGAFFHQQIVVNERFELDVGLGGVFQFPKRELVQKDIFGSQYKMFYLGPTTAKGTFSFGDVEKPYLKASLGMFPYKYNNNASNLGEYLFRTGPYPTYIMTGGFAFIDNATAYLQGLHLQSEFGGFKGEILLTTESSLPPLYDFSLSGLVQYSVLDGLFTVGGGVQFKRLIPIDPEKTTSEAENNTYFHYNGKDYTLAKDFYDKPIQFWGAKETEYQEMADTLRAQGNAAAAANFDNLVLAAQANAVPYQDEWTVVSGLQSQRDSLQSLIDTSTNPGAVSAATAGLGALPELKHYSTAGTILMAHFSLDVKKLFETELFGPEDLKVFGEVAVLGWKNYPIFYENRSERTPYMVGFNFPGFKILDLISIQYEVFKSKYANNFLALAEARATPYLPPGDEAKYSTNNYNDGPEQETVSWSLVVKKQLYPGFNISAQFARDHLRAVGTDWFFWGKDGSK